MKKVMLWIVITALVWALFVLIYLSYSNMEGLKDFSMGAGIIGLCATLLGYAVCERDVAAPACAEQVPEQREQLIPGECAALGQHLRRIRLRKNLGIEEVAAQSGINSELIERFEDGIAGLYIHDAGRLANAYNISPADLGTILHLHR